MYFVKFPKNIKARLNAINKLADYNVEFVDDIAGELAEEYRRMLVEHIDKQDLNWRPLSPGYLKYKIAAGLSIKIWEATSFLKNHIKVIKIDDGGDLLYFVGLDDVDKYPGSNVSVGLVGMVLEYGSPSRNIPPRPLFRPTRANLRSKITSYVETRNAEFIKFLIKKAR